MQRRTFLSLLGSLTGLPLARPTAAQASTADPSYSDTNGTPARVLLAALAAGVPTGGIAYQA